MTNPVPSPIPSVDVPALLAELASLRDELRTLQREQQAELDRFRVELVDAREEHAERARSGELGQEWRTLQRRVDLGETTVEAVVRGEDDSAQAVVVRGYAQENAETAALELDGEVDEAEKGGEVSPAAAAALAHRAAAAELAAQLERLRALPLPAW